MAHAHLCIPIRPLRRLLVLSACKTLADDMRAAEYVARVFKKLPSNTGKYLRIGNYSASLLPIRFD